MTPAEYLLWQCIRNPQLCHAKFRRQYVKGIYTLDFYCPEAKLCVECDGLAAVSNRETDNLTNVGNKETISGTANPLDT